MFEVCLASANGLYEFISANKRIVEILLLIVMPLAWGLGVEYLFRFIRGRRLAVSKKQETDR